MTIQELIERLHKVEDKTKKVCFRSEKTYSDSTKICDADYFLEPKNDNKIILCQEWI